MRSDDPAYYTQAWGAIFCNHCHQGSDKPANVEHTDECPLTQLRYLEQVHDKWLAEIMKVRLQRAIYKTALLRINALYDQDKDLDEIALDVELILIQIGRAHV